MKKKRTWIKLSETTTESHAEQYARLTGRFPGARNPDQLEHMCRKTHIVICYCPETGKIKKFETQV